jgi:hypothetical protein
MKKWTGHTTWCREIWSWLGVYHGWKSNWRIRIWKL